MAKADPVNPMAKHSILKAPLRLSRVIALAAMSVLSVAGLSAFPSAAHADGDSFKSFSVSTPPKWTPPSFTPPAYTPPTFTPPTFTPPPTVTVTPVPVIPHIPVMVNQPVINPINQWDVTARPDFQDPTGQQHDGALAGVKSLPGDSFPGEGQAGASDALLVKQRDGSEFERLSPASVKLNHGQILASVRRPTRVAFVTTGLLQVALSGDADILMTSEHGYVRVANFDGRGQTVKIKVEAKLISGQDDKVIALAPGYELVVANHALKRSEIRLADGCARRHFKLLEDGKMSICELCPESVLTSSPLIAEMNRQPIDRDRRIIGDMSKMAAVLNYINGTEGFSVDATAPQVAQQKQ